MENFSVRKMAGLALKNRTNRHMRSQTSYTFPVSIIAALIKTWNRHKCKKSTTKCSVFYPLSTGRIKCVHESPFDYTFFIREHNINTIWYLCIIRVFIMLSGWFNAFTYSIMVIMIWVSLCLVYRVQPRSSQIFYWGNQNIWPPFTWGPPILFPRKIYWYQLSFLLRSKQATSFLYCF